MTLACFVPVQRMLDKMTGWRQVNLRLKAGSSAPAMPGIRRSSAFTRKAPRKLGVRSGHERRQAFLQAVLLQKAKSMNKAGASIPQQRGKTGNHAADVRVREGILQHINFGGQVCGHVAVETCRKQGNDPGEICATQANALEQFWSHDTLGFRLASTL